MYYYTVVSQDGVRLYFGKHRSYAKFILRNNPGSYLYKES
jgi:hypothetical protein